MGRHKEWRKIAKKERRRRKRVITARYREGTSNLTISEYNEWLKEQKILETFEIEQIEKENLKEHEKWKEAEEVSEEKWQKLQHHLEKLQQKQLEQEARLKLEWELEKQRKEEEEERLKKIKKENQTKQEIFMKQLEQFLIGDAREPPLELLISRETKPNSELCPFFAKTACCRFGDQCSRNHKYPGISNVILAINFYSHFGLENANFSEYDTDVMLEYEDWDTYKDFQNFFYDVLPEFEKFGKVIQFKVCNNYEKHLRGNTYVEFAELRCAVAAYRALHTRWYGGKQLSLQFCLIDSWKNAICGLQSRKRCPKGRACNFLHVFRNPKDLYSSLHRDRTEESERTRRTSSRSWRWSESPEVELPKKQRSKSIERNCCYIRDKHKESRYVEMDSNRRSSRSHRNYMRKRGTDSRSP